MFNKFKHILEDDTLFFSIVIILIAVTSYGLGRYSQHISVPPVQAQAVTVSQPTPAPPSSTSIATKKQYVASKNGSKYHLLTCPGASQIKEENKVYFNTPEQARAQGYTPAANCPALQ